MNHNTNTSLENFLHCLNPELQEAEVVIDPLDLNIGIIESNSHLTQRIKIKNDGLRGFFSATVHMQTEVNGISITVDNFNIASKLKSSVEIIESEKQRRDIINLFPQESIELVLEINPIQLTPGKEYKNRILLAKNIYSFRQDISKTIEMPFTFYIDIPGVSKKVSDSPLRVKGEQITTLGALAEYCYKTWTNRNDTQLPDKTIEWIRDNLQERDFSERVGEIFQTQVKQSEKCYRFLKLTGVIERERLIQLIRKLTLDELDRERAERLREADNQQQAKVEEQRQRIFNKPNDRAWPFLWFAVAVSIGGGFWGAIVGGVSEEISADTGWRIGLLAGMAISYGDRRNRANTLTRQYIDSTRDSVENQKRGIEESIQDRINNIDADIPRLEQRYSLTLSETIRTQERISDSSSREFSAKAPANLTSRYASVVAVSCVLLVIYPSLIFSNIRTNTLEEAYATPSIVQNAFPFEGGLIGEWTAIAGLTAYKSEGDTSAVAFSLMPDEKFTALSSNIHVDQVGIAKVHQSIKPAIGNDSLNKEFYSRRGLKRGDIIGVICYAGEGYCYVWVRGNLGCIEMSWLDNEPKLKKGDWIRKPGKWTLWVKVKNYREKVGWVKIPEEFDFSKIKGMSRYG